MIAAVRGAPSASCVSVTFETPWRSGSISYVTTVAGSAAISSLKYALQVIDSRRSGSAARISPSSMTSGAPKAFIDKFADAMSKVLAMPDVRDRLTAMGLTVGYMTPQQLTSREQAYTQVWTRLIKASGFQAQ